MNKLFMLLFVTILLAGNLSAAFEFDNVKIYNETTKTITIKNVWGAGKIIANAQLNTPEIYYVIDQGEGIDQLVAEFTIENFEIYNPALNKMDFYNIDKGMSKFSRDFTYKEKIVTAQRAVPQFETICNEITHANSSVENVCYQNQIGVIYEDVFYWDEITGVILNPGNITIGIFTDIQPNDNVEWIPTLFGVEIDEWAVWVSSLNVGLTHYWNFDETSGINASDKRGQDIGNPLNMNFTGATFNTTSILGNSAYCDGTNDFGTTTGGIGGLPNGTGDWSISLWFNDVNSAASGITWASASGFGERMIDVVVPANNFRVFFAGGDTGNLNVSIVQDGTRWYHVVIIRNQSAVNELTTYINGTLKSTTAGAGTITGAATKICEDSSGGSDFKGHVDELGIWNRSISPSEVTNLYNNHIGITYPGTLPEVTLNTPLDGINQTSNQIIFNCSSTSPSSLLNLSLTVDNVLNLTIFNTTPSQTSLSLQSTTDLNTGTHNWSCVTYDNSGNSAISSTRTFTVGFIENNQTFNSTSFETAQETFVLNLSGNGTETITAELIYNGTNKGNGTKDGTNFEATFTKIIQIPTGIAQSEDRTFFWKMRIGGVIFNSTTNTQTINRTTFILCNTTIPTTYVNFTFKNETVAEEDVNATFVSTFVYWLGNGEVNKTLTFSNATENINYAFCLEPPDKNLNVDIEIDYNNGESQQRTFLSTSLLTNVTLQQVLYLLPTSLGLFSQFKTVNSVGDTIKNVKATIIRLIGVSIVTVNVDFTDDSGLVVFFLNPDITYTGTFSKTGFVDNVFSFVPVTDLRTVIMGGGGVAVIGNGTTISQGTIYSITPTNNSLLNKTTYTFGLNVTSNQTITLMSLNISNSSGSQLLFVTNSTQGFISGTANTGNNTQLIGRYIIQTASETITFSKVWTIGDFFIGSYSLFRQMTLYTQYGFGEFIRIIMVLSIILGVLIFMSGTQVIESSESKVIVTILLIWAFSIVGWLDTGLAVDTSTIGINNLSQFSNQFGIAILTTGAGVFFIFRRIF